MEKDEFITAGQRLYGKHGWQSQLAEGIGKSPATIWRYAHGKLPIPRHVEVAIRGLEANHDR